MRYFTEEKYGNYLLTPFYDVEYMYSVVKMTKYRMVDMGISFDFRIWCEIIWRKITNKYIYAREFTNNGNYIGWSERWVGSRKQLTAPSGEKVR